mgnify:CR=1 FL=1
MLILPDHPDFYSILHSSPPPGWRDTVTSEFGGCLAVRADSLLLAPLTPEEEAEYLFGGEYDELAYLEDADPDC